MVIKLFAKPQFAFFLLANGMAACCNFGSRIILGNYMGFAPSIILAYFIGMVIAFLLCRYLVFKSQENNLIQQISYFCLVNGLGITITLAVSLALANYILIFVNPISWREALAHFIGICAPAFTSYLGHRHLSFR